MAGQKSLESKLDYLKNKDTTHKAASLCIARQAVGINDSNDFRNVYIGLKDKRKNIDKAVSKQNKDKIVLHQDVEVVPQKISPEIFAHENHQKKSSDRAILINDQMVSDTQ